MKKRLIFLLLAELVAATLHAQEGEILYVDYGEQGISHGFGPEIMFNGPGAWHVDFDQDGENDFYYRSVWGTFAPDGCNFNWVALQESIAPAAIHKLSGSKNGRLIQVGDTITNPSLTWLSAITFPEPHEIAQELKPIVHFVAFRIPMDEDFCYGWIEQDFRYDSVTVDTLNDEWCLYKPVVTLRRVAYCTIPNYPLQIGQTSFDWGTEENEATAFATLHPNPTSGQVNITGKALRQAEVVNLLGQRVAIIAGDGDVLHIDMGKLPEGVYFVNITDAEGRTCVRKVVKE